ncbi:CcdC protein domain-containing protein [Novosphingobium sp. AP12]|uniref:CcdC protein domain-containing protein n=1 Tax=Novosphingobium sp. AP12 TaxID=1144305 RepID=UPI0002720FA2|nr:CcdC protein domain-containing protein [Novosphingobium sp. AP12]EJL32397.1 hypothetical protein PMI02_01452 [Novosphingobium sp. AP12]
MGGSAGAGWTAHLPLLIFAGVMAWRFRNLQKARPLRLPLLWIMPLIVTAALCLAVAAMPPTGPGWLVLATGFGVGGGIGMQRSRLMRLHIEGEEAEARIMLRQSPLALALILAVFAARRMLLPTGAALQDSHPSATALLMTDAMFGLVLGMAVLSRMVLWQRARAMAVAHVFDA